MRDYKNIESHLDELLEDVYPQPVDEGHTAFLLLDVLDNWIDELEMCDSVLDVGCGEAFLQHSFEGMAMDYTGVCLGDDYTKAKELDRNVEKHDFNFMPYKNESFDLVFARHALEHSVMPLISLMEWHRVSKKVAVSDYA